jgi:hypothetical protein
MRRVMLEWMMNNELEWTPRRAIVSYWDTSRHLIRYSDGLLAGGRSSIPSRSKEFFLLLVVQIGSAVRPACYKMGTGALYPRIKQPGRETDHSPPSSSEVKNGGAIIPLPPHIFLVWCFTFSHFIPVFPAETEENHKRPQPAQLVPLLRFEPGTSRTEVGSLIAYIALHALWISHKVIWDWTRGSGVRSQDQSAWVTDWPPSQLFLDSM